MKTKINWILFILFLVLLILARIILVQDCYNYVWGAYLFIFPTMHYAFITIFKCPEKQSIKYNFYALGGVLITMALARDPLNNFVLEKAISATVGGVITYILYRNLPKV
jgi:hypothetical protein